MSLPLTLMRMPYTQHRATANSLKGFRSRSVKHDMYAAQYRMVAMTLYAQRTVTESNAASDWQAAPFNIWQQCTLSTKDLAAMTDCYNCMLCCFPLIHSHDIMSAEVLLICSLLRCVGKRAHLHACIALRASITCLNADRPGPVQHQPAAEWFSLTVGRCCHHEPALWYKKKRCRP